MPIRPENVDRYPPDWPIIRDLVLRRARHRCERCGVRNGEKGGRTRGGIWLRTLPLGERLGRLEWPEPGTWAWCSDGTTRDYVRIIRIVLTIAHLDHVPEHCALENLEALCQRCHLAHDLKHHLQTRYASRRKGLAIADLFPEGAIPE
jgi:5-methylcytosine-specific restriction endonuclease McrA